MIFKREKELARKLEFDGLYITEQPEDDDVKGQVENPSPSEEKLGFGYLVFNCSPTKTNL